MLAKDKECPFMFSLTGSPKCHGAKCMLFMGDENVEEGKNVVNPGRCAITEIACSMVGIHNVATKSGPAGPT